MGLSSKTTLEEWEKKKTTSSYKIHFSDPCFQMGWPMSPLVPLFQFVQLESSSSLIFETSFELPQMKRAFIGVFDIEEIAES